MASLFEVKPSPGKGNGLFTTQDIGAGTTTLRDKQVIFVRQREVDVSERAVRAAFDKLSRSEQRQFLQLHAADESRGNVGKSRLYRIYKDNVFGDDDGSWMALTVSRINHSCAPNAMITDAPYGSTDLEVVAEKTISEGEEVTISYKEGILQTLTCRQRKSLFRASYGFECSCAECTLDSDDLKISDMRHELACCLWYGLRGWKQPDLDAVGDNILSRTPEEAARFEKLIKDLDVPLTPSDRTTYNLVLVNLYEAEGVSGGMIAETYASAAMALWDQVLEMGDIVIL